MTPLVYLANMCCMIDKTYSVSLEYGAHTGELPHWQMRVYVPRKAIRLARTLERGDDRQANVSAALSLGKELQRYAPELFSATTDVIIDVLPPPKWGDSGEAQSRCLAD